MRTAQMKRWLGRLVWLPVAWSPGASAEYGINFPPPATPAAREIYDIHMLTMGIAFGLLVITFCIVIYALYAYRKSRGFQPDREFHKGWFSHWSWVIVPAIVLGVDLTCSCIALIQYFHVYIHAAYTSPTNTGFLHKVQRMILR